MVLTIFIYLQCYEGKPLFEIDRARTLRSGLVGFTLHGSLSHFYYQFCEELFPFQDWWVVPAKVAFDQTVWSAIWNSIYFTVLGFLRLESPLSIFKELKATFLPMLTVRNSSSSLTCKAVQPDETFVWSSNFKELLTIIFMVF